MSPNMNAMPYEWMHSYPCSSIKYVYYIYKFQKDSSKYINLFIYTCLKYINEGGSVGFNGPVIIDHIAILKGLVQNFREMILSYPYIELQKRVSYRGSTAPN